MKSQQDWYKIANSINEINFSNNGLAEIEVNGKTVCLVLQKGVLYACSYKCPHAGGILKDGYIDALGNIVCSLHQYKFCLKTGRNISGEGYFLKTFPIKMHEEGIFIQLKNGNFTL